LEPFSQVVTSVVTDVEPSRQIGPLKSSV